MRETIPKVHLIAFPAIHWDNLKTYVDSVGGYSWTDRIGKMIGPGGEMRDGEALVEAAGRICYRSWAPQLNANVRHVREDSSAYLLNILQTKHGSVLEHANYSFIFEDVSRVFTHELVRHRAGVAVSQESLRYVRLTDIGFRIPPILEQKSPFVRSKVIGLVEALEEIQKDFARDFGLDDEGIPFGYKKQVTSALRRLAPIGLSTSMIWTANVRTIRHVISMRTEKGAEEEIRLVFDQVATIMQEWAPMLFSDYSKNTDGEWITPFWKV